MISFYAYQSGDSSEDGSSESLMKKNPEVSESTSTSLATRMTPCHAYQGVSAQPFVEASAMKSLVLKSFKTERFNTTRNQRLIALAIVVMVTVYFILKNMTSLPTSSTTMLAASNPKDDTFTIKMDEGELSLYHEFLRSHGQVERNFGNMKLRGVSNDDTN